MKKALLPLAIAALLPASAFADVTVYGRATLSFQQANLKNQTPGQSATFFQVYNNESRLGVKGSEELNEDLKAIYQYELKIFADDGSTITQRNTFVGLQGGFGTVKAGMFDTPLKLAQEKTDVFKDMIGDWKNVFQGETRAKNSFQYSTPTWNHVTANIDYVAPEAYAKGVAQNGYSTSVVWDTKQFYAAIANDHNVSNSQSAVKTTTAAGPFLSTDITRVVGRAVFGPVVLGAMYQTYDNGVKNAKGDVSKDGFMFSGIYNITSAYALKAQLGDSDQVTLGGKTWSIGLDQKLSKATKLTYFYTTFADDGYNSTNKKNDATLKHDDKWAGVALELNF